jgi:hypothetical protein
VGTAVRIDLSAIALSIAGFVCTEILLLTAGLTVLPAPSVLVVASVLSLWFWIAFWASHKSLTPILSRWTDDADFVQRPLSLMASLYVALLIGVTAGPKVERALWLSGNFGESPWNRCEVLMTIPTGGALIEFSVAATDVAPDIMALVSFNRALVESDPKGYWWFSNSGLKEVPDSRLMRFPVMVEGCPRPLIRCIKINGYAITKTTSLYFQLDGVLPNGLIPIDAWFGHSYEIEDDPSAAQSKARMVGDRMLCDGT